MCTAVYKTDSQWEDSAEHRELSSVLCDNLEGWMGDGLGGRFKREGNICILTAESRCCMAKTSTTL